MGAYTTRMAEDNEIKDIIESVKSGYTDNNGVHHKPNNQVATILTLQSNLGCRIGDICALKAENFVQDGETWRLNMTEQKTGKSRVFIVPKQVKGFIDKWMQEKGIHSGSLFSISEYAVWKQVRGVTNYLGLEDISCHSLRKAAGMRVYLESGKDIALTTQYYQHSSPTVTMKYLKRSSKQMDDAISKSVFMV